MAHDSVPDTQIAPVCPWWDAQKGGCYAPERLISYKLSVQQLVQKFTDSLLRDWGCRLVTAWSLDPVGGILVLTAVSGADKALLAAVHLDCAKHLSGVTVDERVVKYFKDVREPYPDGRQFGDRDLIKALGLRSMISVPVLNTANPNQVLSVINLFPQSGSPLNQELTPFYGRQLEAVGDHLAIKLETCLMDASVAFANRLRIDLIKLGAGKRYPERQCKVVARLVEKAVECNAVGVFLETPDEKGIELLADVGGVYRQDRPRNAASGPAYAVWKSNREVLSLDLRQEKDLDVEVICSNTQEHLTGAHIALRDVEGKPRGVISCINRSSDSSHQQIRPFTFEDVAIVSAIGQAFAQQMEILLADRQRLESLTKLAHELRVPVVAFRAVLERLQTECARSKYVFPYNHFEEMTIYTDVMRRLLTELDFIRLDPARIPMEFKATPFLAVIVQPARRFVEPLLRKKGLAVGQIRHEGLDGFPRLYLDQALMTQTVFNLLDNAIKYYHGDRRAFHMMITGTVLSDCYEISFQDNGPGVPKGLEEQIFEFGVRGHAAHGDDVAGEGIGLWFAREVVRRHGGSLELRRNANPTEFVMCLPRSLQYRPPDLATAGEEES